MIFGIGASGGVSDSREVSEFEKSGKREISEKQEAQQTTTQKQESTGQTTQQTTGRFLDEATEQTLQGLISSISTSSSLDARLAESGIEGQQASLDFARSLTDRATQTGQFVSEQIEPILSEARRVGEDELGRQVTQIGQQAGSNLNSFVQLAAAEGRADLESQLAALNADLVLQGRELESRDVIAASNALQQASVQAQAPREASVNQVSQLANILRGATSETAATGTSAEQATGEIESLSNALREVLEQFEEEGRIETQGRGSQISAGSSFSI